MVRALFVTALFRGMLAHRLRLALTGLAIALGVAFMAGSFIFSATLIRSLDSLFTQASTGTDVEVTHSSPGGSTITGSPAQPLPASVLTAVRSVPGVAAADGEISGQAVLLGRDGKPLPGAFGVALSWPADAPFQAAFGHRSGQPPAGPGQVMIDRASARRGHFTAGQMISIAIAGHAVPFTITGITGYGTADTIAGGSMAIFSLPAAQQHPGHGQQALGPGRVEPVPPRGAGRVQRAQPVRVSAWVARPGSRPSSVRARPASPGITAVAKL